MNNAHTDLTGLFVNTTRNQCQFYLPRQLQPVLYTLEAGNVYKYQAVYQVPAQVSQVIVAHVAHATFTVNMHVKSFVAPEIAYAWPGQVLCVETRVIIRVQPHCRVYLA